MNLISTQLELKNYLDISIIDNSFDIENPKFTCDVTFSIGTSSSGLFFDVHQVNNMFISYKSIDYNDEGDENAVELQPDLNEYTKEIVIDKSNEDNKSLVLHEVEINTNKSLVILYFSY